VQVELAMDRVEVSGRVITVVHRDDDARKTTDLRHDRPSLAGCSAATLSARYLLNAFHEHRKHAERGRARPSRESNDYPSHAQPGPTWHTLSRAMHVLPQAFPRVQILQQAC
jgi:hypothetical protein